MLSDLECQDRGETHFLNKMTVNILVDAWFKKPKN